MKLFVLYLCADIFAVVTKTEQTYRLAIFCDENVPPFGPTLPNPPEFTVSGNTKKRQNNSTFSLVLMQYEYAFKLFFFSQNNIFGLTHIYKILF